MKNTIKTFFYLLFIPYILIILCGVLCAFCGICIGFFGDQSLSYGTEAYLAVVIFTLLGCWYIPIPCFILQIVLLILEKVKNKGAIRFCIMSMPVVYVILALLGYGVSSLAG